MIGVERGEREKDGIHEAHVLLSRIAILAVAAAAAAAAAGADADAGAGAGADAGVVVVGPTPAVQVAGRAHFDVTCIDVGLG